MSLFHRKLGFALAFFAIAAIAEPPQVNVENPFNADNVFDATSALSQSSGRKGKTNGAQIAAMIGAGVASGMCLYLMKKARELPPGSEKTLMQMQAMQQCQQAAQNMANAGQNGDNADDLSSPQVAQNGLPQNPQAATEAPQQGAQQQFLPGGQGSTPANNFQAPTLAQAEEQEAAAPTNTEPGRRGVGTVNSLARAPSLSQSVLSPIPEQSLTFDDQAGLNNGGGVAGGSGAYLASSGDIDFDKLEEKLSAQEALDKLEESARRIREKGDTAGGANGDAGGGDSTDNGDEDGGFNNVLSSFFGGGGGQVITPGGTGAGALALNGKDGAKKPGINIFEYATYRYKRLQRKEGRIVSKLALAKPKKPGQK